MTTHYRETIMTALANQLGIIGTVVDGYTWSPSAVTPAISRMKPDSLASPTLPIIYIGGTQETYEPRSSETTYNIYTRSLNVRMVYLVEAWTGDSAISDMLYDVETALRDPTIGNTADDVVFQNYRSLFDADGQPMNGIEINLMVRYRTATNAPQTRR